MGVRGYNNTRESKLEEVADNSKNRYNKRLLIFSTIWAKKIAN
jgi:hypothetical protein